MPGVDARVGGRWGVVLPGVLALVACGGGGGGPHSPVPQIPSAALSTVTVTPGEGLDADGVDDAVVVITARDTNGHTISGLTVTIAASGSNNVVTQPPVVTNPMGATSGHVAATSTGARTLTITLDPAGANVALTTQPVVRFGPRAQLSGAARYFDVDGSGKAGAGDTLVLTFDRAVSVSSNAAASFALPVAGDFLGTGATVAAGPLGTQVTVTLGTTPNLRTRDLFSTASVVFGAASGIDVSAAIATGAIVDVASGQTVVPTASGDGVDVAAGFVATPCQIEDFTASCVVPVDHDRNGILDAFLVNASNGNVLLLKNVGPGTFVNTAQGFIDGTCLAVGDLDGNGTPDLVVGRDDGNGDHVFLDSLLGNYGDSGQALGSYATTCVALADVGGDGDLDLIDGCSDAPLHVYMNDGAGTFTESLQTFGSAGTLALAVGDLDGDGDVDVVAGGSFADDQVFLNDGGGVFTATGVSFHAEITGRLALADLDRDGDLDVVTVDALDHVDFFENDGAAGFTATGDLIDGLSARDVAVADVDADGRADLMVAGMGGFYVYALDADGHLPPNGVRYGTTTAMRLAVADWSSDGDPDVVTYGSFAPCTMYHDSRTGTFGPAVWSDSGQVLGAGHTAALAAGDVDGDGDVDYVQGVDAGSTRLWRNDGTADFTPTSAITTTAVTSVALGDVDRDGHQDLVVGYASFGGLGVFLGDGTGTFTDTAQTLGSDTTAALALGDVDGDGDLDVVQGVSLNSTLVWLNDGAGNLTDSGQSLGFAAVSAVALGDVDDDGDLDVVLGVAGGGAETVWSNDGSGTFTLLGSFGAGDTRALVLADLDGDRDLDVVVGNLANGDTVWRNDGSGSFTDTLQSLGSSTTVALTGADVDQDGDLDYFGSFGLAGLHVFLNDGDANFLDGGPVGEASSSFATVAADFDRDGAPDVVAAGGGTAGEVVELHD